HRQRYRARRSFLRPRRAEGVATDGRSRHDAVAGHRRGDQPLGGVSWAHRSRRASARPARRRGAAVGVQSQGPPRRGGAPPPPPPPPPRGVPTPPPPDIPPTPRRLAK